MPINQSQVLISYDFTTELSAYTTYITWQSKDEDVADD